MNNFSRWALIALIVSGGTIISSLLLSKMFVRIRHEQAISVKGYAEQNAVSDVGKFSCRVSARGTTLQESYAALQVNREAVQRFLKQRGFQDSEIELGTIDVSKVAKRDAQGKEMNEIEFLDSYQTFTLTSANVIAIRDASTGITELIKDGVDVTAYSPEFLITDLAPLKLELLAKATADGLRRAKTLAENSGGRVGNLASAEQGVFQITRRNSTDTSGYGMYDTSTIEKTIKATVTLEYAVERASASK